MGLLNTGWILFGYNRNLGIAFYNRICLKIGLTCAKLRAQRARARVEHWQSGRQRDQRRLLTHTTSHIPRGKKRG